MIMNLFVLTFFIAAAATDPAATGTSSTNANNSSKNSATATPTKKNSKSTATIVADPNAPQDTSVALPKSKKNQASDVIPTTGDAADPSSIVGSSIDAATQIANDAAKAALEEAAKLSAIGSDSDKSSPAGSVINTQTINAATDGAVAVAKEIKKPKVKKAAEDTGTTDEAAPKPVKKPKASNSDGATAPAPTDNPATKN
jgi:hypothetical protein